MTHKPNLQIIRNVDDILVYFENIKTLSNSEKDSLGFLPFLAIKEAIQRNKLFLLVDTALTPNKLAGYLLHSGGYPHAKIQQIATMSEYRSLGVGSTLIRCLVSDLEQLGFMSIQADIAEDLKGSLDFYKKNGFQFIRRVDGGKSRKRQILIHSRELETDTLFNSTTSNVDFVDLGMPSKRFGITTAYALDLNVYLDFAKKREYSEQAGKLFKAALSHELRLAVSSEFSKELLRNSSDRNTDPILELALRIPQIPATSLEETKLLADKIHKVIFEDTGNKNAGTDQSLSDAKHVAHAAMTRAAFVTRDKAILNSKVRLYADFGIAVLTVDELISLLPQNRFNGDSPASVGQDFHCSVIKNDQIVNHLNSLNLNSKVFTEFTEPQNHLLDVVAKAVFLDGQILAISIMHFPRTTNSIGRLFIHVLPEASDAYLYADHLLDCALSEASSGKSVTLQLAQLQGQSVVTSLAKSRGFHTTSGDLSLSKVAIGRPVTKNSWGNVQNDLYVKSKLKLPTKMPKLTGKKAICIETSDGTNIETTLNKLEDILSPTLFIWPDRDGVIVPITKQYSGQLLGTDDQYSMDFIKSKDASFLSVRAYVKRTHSVLHMRSDTPILFYESGKDDGAMAVVAIARIVNSLVIKADDIPNKYLKRLVVENVNDFSSTSDVLITNFDNLLRFPTPISFQKLKQIGAVNGANLISSSKISDEIITKIVDLGWGDVS